MKGKNAASNVQVELQQALDAIDLSALAAGDSVVDKQAGDAAASGASA